VSVRRLGSILAWSAISAAFIGPGTVTTAGAAGAGFDYRLLWVVVLSTAVCLVLQEASARLTVASGQGLAGAIRSSFGSLPGALVVGAVVFGCAAFEAGNILGAAAGASLALPVSSRLLAAACGLVGGIVLMSRSPSRVARLMGILVALMGVAFLAAAIGLNPGPTSLAGGLTPAVPSGSAALVLGLFGTTVVPYNLFLGSRLARGQTLGQVRFGLGVAVPLGGVITMAIVVVGSALDGPFSYQGLATALSGSLGVWAGSLFSVGLLTAGLSSAVTAPLAAAVTVESYRHSPAADQDPKSQRLAFVWMSVLAVGVAFGVAGVPPIPAIILAQAVNGALLPFVAVFLLLAVNDRQLMGDEQLGGALSNTLLALAVLASLTLGVTAAVRAVERALNLAPTAEHWLVVIAAGIAGVLAIPLARATARRRRGRH
jgi:Mn2+/Fe2+ NRAMP family transporter